MIVYSPLDSAGRTCRRLVSSVTLVFPLNFPNLVFPKRRKVKHALVGRRPVSPATDVDFEI